MCMLFVGIYDKKPLYYANVIFKFSLFHENEFRTEFYSNIAQKHSMSTDANLIGNFYMFNLNLSATTMY